MLDKNKGFQTVRQIARILSGEEFGIDSFEEDLTAMSDIVFFKYAPITSVEAVAAGDKSIVCATPSMYGSGSLSSKALGYGLNCQVSIPDGRGVHFFHYFLSRLVLESTQPPVK